MTSDLLARTLSVGRVMAVVAACLWAPLMAGAQTQPETPAVGGNAPAATVPTGPSSFSGRLVLPEGVAADAVVVRIYDGPVTEVEGEWAPSAEFPVGADGLFELTWEVGAHTHIEVVGPGIRRARFPWPDLRSEPEGTRAVFRLEPGVSMDVEVLDSQTDEPVAGAVIGMVFPGPDAPYSARDTTYPFYEVADGQGRVTLHGLLPGIIYDLHATAPGYERQRRFINPGHGATFRLRRGGFRVEGTAVGHRSGQNKPLTMVRVVNRENETGIHVTRRADAQGNFVFDGLANGQYVLYPVVPEAGDVRGFDLFVGGSSQAGIQLITPEGIEVAGTVIDRDTQQPVAGARLTLLGETVTTDGQGNFAFPPIMGPWPATPTIDHAAYRYVEADQDQSILPINGFEMQDVYGVVIPLRLRRFVHVVQEPPAGAEVQPAVLELWGPIAEEGKPEVRRERLEGVSRVIELDSPGLRAALLRDASGRVSEVMPLSVEADVTSVTLRMPLGFAAGVAGSVQFDDGRAPAPTFTAELLSDLNGLTSTPFALQTLDTPTQGRFEFPRLAPGRAQLKLTGPGGRMYGEFELDLVRGQTIRHDVTVGRGLVLAGHVIDHEGNGIAQITLSAYGNDPEGNQLHLRAVSGDRGAYRFEGFGGPTLTQLQADHFAFSPLVLRDVPLPDENFEVKLPELTAITVKLGPGFETQSAGAVAYLMLGRQQGLELAPAQWFYEIDVQQPFSGEAEVLLNPRSEGRMRVAVQAGGRWDVSEAFDWRLSSEPKTLTLSPSHGANLQVSLTGIDGAAASQLEFDLLNTSIPSSMVPPMPPAVVSARPSPRASFQGLPAGEYLLLALSPTGQHAVRANIQVGGGQTASAVLAFEAMEAEVTGVVRRMPQNQPVAGAQVRLYFGDIAEPPVLAERPTDGSGQFRFFPVPAERPYLIEARVPGDPTPHYLSIERAQTGVTLNVTAQVRVTVVLPGAIQQRAGARRGVPFVFFAEGPGAGATATLDQLNEVMLAPGRYRVSWGEDEIGIMEVPVAPRATVPVQ